MSRVGVTAERIRTGLESVVGRGKAPASGHVPFTPRAKKVLELALRESRERHHAHIGPEHLLLAIVREEDRFDAVVGLCAALTATVGAPRSTPAADAS